ncbi:MAG: hypothetical protein CEN91_156 [Candidatus Berkelbacteria bacterium Licking1014_85]|uniref:Uncharacterized protein n=1 Tax=Candidatus Berkelbacteria bacterium Licking1014_85 TaxID=2017148 RepID=A0A554LLB8_9BACT|nr:MAG: hypothetical protein CEN91_156 [Candidatus Berkelbacteria bacterium Licking1014_85]
MNTQTVKPTGCCEPFDPDFSYTTCPKCAKVYGKNYVVLFAQVG